MDSKKKKRKKSFCIPRPPTGIILTIFSLSSSLAMGVYSCWQLCLFDKSQRRNDDMAEMPFTVAKYILLYIGAIKLSCTHTHTQLYIIRYCTHTTLTIDFLQCLSSSFQIPPSTRFTFFSTPKRRRGQKLSPQLLIGSLMFAVLSILFLYIVAMIHSSSGFVYIYKNKKSSRNSQDIDFCGCEFTSTISISIKLKYIILAS